MTIRLVQYEIEQLVARCEGIERQLAANDDQDSAQRLSVFVRELERMVAHFTKLFRDGESRMDKASLKAADLKRRQYARKLGQLQAFAQRHEEEEEEGEGVPGVAAARPHGGAGPAAPGARDLDGREVLQRRRLLGDRSGGDGGGGERPRGAGEEARRQDALASSVVLLARELRSTARGVATALEGDATLDRTAELLGANQRLMAQARGGVEALLRHANLSSAPCVAATVAVVLAVFFATVAFMRLVPAYGRR